MTPAPITTADMRALLEELAGIISIGNRQRAETLRAIAARLEQQEPQPANRGELTALVKRLRALPDLTDAVDLLGGICSTLTPTSTSVDVAALRALPRYW